MNRYTVMAAVIALLSAAPPSDARPAAGPPTRVGTCAFTTVRKVTQRLEDGTHHPVANTGSNIGLANGVWGVSYDEIAAVNASRVGDPAMTCLVRLPRHCPPGDQRGKMYTTTNLRTEESWTLPDAEHQCGGA